MSDGRHYEVRRGKYLVSTAVERLDLDVIHGFLRGSYWAENVPRAIVERSIEHSLCFGLYESVSGLDLGCGAGKQIGFARVVTDRATYGYLADVFVLESHRGRGLGHFLIEALLEHPDVKGLRRFGLVTLDAHGLYEKSGFGPLQHPERHLERVALDAYGAGTSLAQGGSLT